MSFLLYEVWAEDQDGHQELIDTTASQTEAFKLAEKFLGEHPAVVVFKETEDGDTVEIKRFELS